MTHKIRKATISDHEIILNIAKSLPEWFDEHAQNFEIPEDLINYQSLVYEDNGQILGFVNFAQENAPEIKWIGVVKNARRQGIGTKLVKDVEEILLHFGFKELRVKTLSENEDYEPYQSTRSFYHKLGFQEIGTEYITSFDGEKLPMSVLKKDLS
ncbi:MAG: family N-acetyltransferase [Candidatus Berkelbacteria bacterium]|nr:family N-acetyltransferase [Candidatus Berkelbacteria bacterium]